MESESGEISGMGLGAFHEISLLKIFLYLIIQAVLRIDY